MFLIEKIEIFFVNITLVGKKTQTRLKTVKSYQTKVKMAAMMKTECSVCCDEKTTMLKCASCDYDVCKTCVKTYLLGSTDEPHCMNCRTGWDRDLQYELLGKSFINGDYRKHRKEVLFNSEVAQLPATQFYVDACIEEEECEKKKSELRRVLYKDRRVLTGLYSNRRKKMNLLKDPRYINEAEQKVLKDECIRLKEDIRYTRSNINSSKLKMKEYDEKIHECLIIKGSGQKKGKSHIHYGVKCPADGCKGYVSASKCIICSHHLCKKCYALVDTEEELKSHVCDKEAYETTQMIIKSSKGCPSCGTRISKVSGCDQMWCPECEVGFLWSTGEKVNGVIHNPHFYQYQKIRGGNNTRVNRNAGDRHCGGLVNTSEFVRKMRIIINKMSDNTSMENNMSAREKDKMERKINDIYRSTGHFQHVLDRIRRDLNVGVNNINIRSKYMRNQLSKEKFMTSIMRENNRLEKSRSLQNVYELYVTVGTEQLNTLYDIEIDAIEKSELRKKVNDMCDVMKEIRDYTNIQLTRISKNYGVVVELFSDYSIFETYRHRV